jgi:probable rRNA maturation factor
VTSATVAWTGSLRRAGSARRFSRDLLALARRAARARRGPISLSVALLSDAEIARLNRRFLGHRGPTDVISFALSPPGRRLEGELAVGVETARREAASRGHAAYDELMLYVAHGLLHLLGHDDAEPAARARMRRAERAWLAGLGLASPYGAEEGR